MSPTRFSFQDSYRYAGFHPDERPETTVVEILETRLWRYRVRTKDPDEAEAAAKRAHEARGDPLEMETIMDVWPEWREIGAVDV